MADAVQKPSLSRSSEPSHDSQPGRAHTPDADAYPQPYSPRTIFWLRTLVIGMAVLIFLGLIGLIVGIARVASEVGETASAGAGNSSQVSVDGRTGGVAPGDERNNAALSSAAQKPSPTLVLPAGAEVRHIALDGNQLAVHYAGPDGNGIVVYNLGTGAETARLPIQRGD